MFCDLAKQYKDIAIFIYSVLNKTSIPLALVGYKMIIANEECSAELAIIISNPTIASGIIVKCNPRICVLILVYFIV